MIGSSWRSMIRQRLILCVVVLHSMLHTLDADMQIKSLIDNIEHPSVVSDSASSILTASMESSSTENESTRRVASIRNPGGLISTSPTHYTYPRISQKYRHALSPHLISWPSRPKPIINHHSSFPDPKSFYVSTQFKSPGRGRQYGGINLLHYGSANKSPHPSARAPPTPPLIKYDGWQPIPGLVARPLIHLPYSSQHQANLAHANDVFIIQPPPHTTPATHGLSSLNLASSYGSSAGISDSYGAPLNTVTGSGGVVSTSGDAHIKNRNHQSAITLGLTAAGIQNTHDTSLSVIKSIGYEIFQKSKAPSAPSAPSALSFDNELNLSSSDVGLIPPSGLYGRHPASTGIYGTQLLTAIEPPSQIKIAPAYTASNFQFSLPSRANIRPTSFHSHYSAPLDADAVDDLYVSNDANWQHQHHREADEVAAAESELAVNLVDSNLSPAVTVSANLTHNDVSSLSQHDCNASHKSTQHRSVVYGTPSASFQPHSLLSTFNIVDAEKSHQSDNFDRIQNGHLSGAVPHEHVLNDGLLQSILSAIEQPVVTLPLPALHHTTDTIDRQHLGIRNILQLPLTLVSTESTESTASQTSPIHQINIKLTESNDPQSNSAPLQLIDNNEIALYFKNNHISKIEENSK